MSRRLLIAVTLFLAFAGPAVARTSGLMPGVSYETGVQFTSHGPVALHVVTGPRPTGLYALRPVLSNELVPGTERVTSMQKRLSAGATMVGVNADFFNFASGRPSGVLMRDGVVDNPPYGDRSSIGVTADGALDVRKIEFFGTWRGLGQRRAINDLNQLPGPNGISLFTQSYGPATPRQNGSVEAVLFPFPAVTPNTDLVGPVIQLAGAGGTPIPVGGAVLVARGTAAQKLMEEAPVGTSLALRVIFRPEWGGIVQAVGGGPAIVRDRTPVFRALEAFSPQQLVPRNSRTAIGQLADGRIILVATDGNQPGYSVGMTNFELAQTMVRLGAVTASGFDAGGSATLAFDGSVLNRPSGGVERSVSTSLQLMYYGVYVPPVAPVVSPNGDGVDETQSLAYKVVRPSTVTVSLTATDGSVAFAEQGAKEPGVYRVAFPPVLAPPPPPPPADPNAPTPLPAPPAPPTPAGPPAEGAWQLEVRAVDNQGQASTERRTFSVNNTLADVKLSTGRLVARLGSARRIQAGVTLTHAAKVTATVETRSGYRVATIATRSAPEGRLVVPWNGTTRGGKALVYGGRYVIRFRAVNELGTVELASAPFKVERAAPVKKKTAKKKPKPK